MVDVDRGMRAKAAFALGTGTLYVVLGALQVLAGLGLRGWLAEMLLLNGGAMDGVVLVIVGAVLLQGHRELSAGMPEGVAFVYMGILLAVFFLVVELSRIGASYLGAWSIGGDWAGYTAWDTISPALYLSPLPLVGLGAWRGAFTLAPRGVLDANGIVIKR